MQAEIHVLLADGSEIRKTQNGETAKQINIASRFYIRDIFDTYGEKVAKINFKVKK